MTPERWEQLNALFHAAAALGAGERRAYLQAAGEGDVDLIAEAERLLVAHERPGGPIELPAIAAAADWFSEEGGAVAGRRLGPYRVIREIARGGMGTVYLAERADGQYEQRVAIKLIKRGMDTALVLDRFRAERQILASLDHPNIAHLLDGGTSDEGLPYFAMEYIEGRPVDEYADAHRLPVEQRLELFLQVCAAVIYAHQHLIVHRDIKPLNILVTPLGVPKLLDFGIAKVLHAGPDEATSTVTGYRLLTPEYASPEQVEGRHATTASDVYSLGVVLYELLSGCSPYHPRSRSPQDVAVAVCTTDPARPSAAIGGPGDPSGGHRRSGLSEDRAAATGTGSAEKLRRRLRGDLDVIVLTALRKEPVRRYASVEQLAGDIRRHLDGLPVQARLDTLRYRAGKYVRRNRVAVTAAALVALALVGGTVATAWQAREARAQAALARAAQARAERRFNDVRKLANTVLFDYHDAIRDLRGSTPVRERLVRDALGYLDGLAAEERNDPSLQRELAGAYRRVGDVQADPAGLDDTQGAVQSYGKAMRILEALHRADSADVRVRRDLAAMALSLGNMVWDRGDLSGGLAYARRARAVLRPLVTAAPADTDLRLELSGANDLLGRISLDAGDIPRSLEFHHEDREGLEAAPESELRTPRLRRALSVAHGHLADAQVESGDLNGALESHRQSLALRTALAAEFPDNADYARLVGSARYYEGTVLGRLGRWGEALQRFRRNLAEDPGAFSHMRAGQALGHLGQLTSALGHYRQALRMHVKELDADSGNLYKRLAVAEDRSSICTTLARLGRAEAAEACAGTAAFVAATVVEPAHAFPRAFFGAIWSTLGEAYDTLAARRAMPAASRRAYRAAAQEVYRRSLETWSDLTARGLVSPADTGRLGAARRAVTRSAAALHAETESRIGAGARAPRQH